jgi:hypothetical protein
LLGGRLVWISTSAIGIWWGNSFSNATFLITCKFLDADDERQHSNISMKMPASKEPLMPKELVFLFLLCLVFSTFFILHTHFCPRQFLYFAF